MPDSETTTTKRSYIGVINTVKTPLGFFVLVVLIVEAFLGIIVQFGGLADPTSLIWGMLGIVTLLILVVAFLAYKRPEVLMGVTDQKNEEQDDIQKLSLIFGELIDIKKLDKKNASCTFTDTTDSENDLSFPQRMTWDQTEGVFIKPKIPGNKDRLYIDVDHEGQNYSGSIPLYSRIVNLEKEEGE